LIFFAILKLAKKRKKGGEKGAEPEWEHAGFFYKLDFFWWCIIFKKEQKRKKVMNVDMVENREKEKGLEGLEELKKKLDKKRGDALGRMTHFARKILDYNEEEHSYEATWELYALFLEEELALVRGEIELIRS